MLPSQREINRMFDDIRHTIGYKTIQETKRLGLQSKNGIHYKALPYRSSKAYESFRRQTGNAHDSIKFKRYNAGIAVYSNLYYVKFLELGTRNMKKRPTIPRAYENLDKYRIVSEIVGLTFK